ncbi:hypothetical protein NQ318_022678 [Aromia moschata]|uniref:Uncharacterized protein n=1 Tax=Aromia moschata TaxID=1265417 RepID=A0AAV8YKS9_9CUCU|nr:hypothetical protein NQ318_022678 [Aromia moschata]
MGYMIYWTMSAFRTELICSSCRMALHHIMQLIILRIKLSVDVLENYDLTFENEFGPVFELMVDTLNDL